MVADIAKLSVVHLHKMEAASKTLAATLQGLIIEFLLLFLCEIGAAVYLLSCGVSIKGWCKRKRNKSRQNNQYLKDGIPHKLQL